MNHNEKRLKIVQEQMDGIADAIHHHFPGKSAVLKSSMFVLGIVREEMFPSPTSDNSTITARVEPPVTRPKPCLKCKGTGRIEIRFGDEKNVKVPCPDCS